MSKKINIEQIKDEAKGSVKEEQSWLLTYADMMTLLFAFFVLLFSMSSPDPVKYAQLKEAMGKEMGITASSLVQNQNEIEQTLEEIIENLNIKKFAKTTRDIRGVALEIDGDICFESGETKMNEELFLILDAIALDVLSNQNDNRGIEVEGHSDAIPVSGDLKEKYADNRELSSVRASRVVSYLEEQGIKKSRLKAIGYGENWPYGIQWYQYKTNKIDGVEITSDIIAKYNNTPEKRKTNRRIKIVFTNN